MMVLQEQEQKQEQEQEQGQGQGHLELEGGLTGSRSAIASIWPGGTQEKL